MIKKASFYFLLIIGGLVIGCKEDPPAAVPVGDVNIEFRLQKDGVNIALEDVFAFDTINQTTVKILKFYLSHINLKKTDGGMVKISDVAIIDFSDTTFTNFSLKGEQATYKSVEFGLGLDPTQNASDPASFTLDHPLSSFFGMYWSWGMKYRFIIMEGTSNEKLSLGGNDDVHFAYHPGADDFYQSYTLPLNFTISSSATNIVINIDFDSIFRGAAGSVDIINENQSHTTPDDYHIAEKMILNFAEGLSAEVK